MEWRPGVIRAQSHVQNPKSKMEGWVPSHATRRCWRDCYGAADVLATFGRIKRLGQQRRDHRLDERG